MEKPYLEAFSREDVERGRRAYETYCECTGWKSAVTGAELPTWEDNPYLNVKVAWVKVGQALKE